MINIPVPSPPSPMQVPGVSNVDFLRMACNARRKQLGQPELDPLEFYAYVMPKVGSLRFLCSLAAPSPPLHHLFLTPLTALVSRLGLFFAVPIHPQNPFLTSVTLPALPHSAGARPPSVTVCILVTVPPPTLSHTQLELLNMEPTFLNRNVNEGFSGGEKKRNEILQLAVLEVRCELWKCEGVEVWGAALTRRSVTRSCSWRCSR